MTSSVLSTPSLSPVSELSFTLSEKFSSILPSATTISPASRRTISPGTTSTEGISIFEPPLITFAVGEDMALRLSRDFSAFIYCTVPKMAFSIRTAKITIVLSTLSDAAEIAAAIIRIMTRRSLNCSKKTWTILFFLPSESLLGPYFWALEETSSLERPSREEL